MRQLNYPLVGIWNQHEKIENSRTKLPGSFLPIFFPSVNHWDEFWFHARLLGRPFLWSQGQVEHQNTPIHSDNPLIWGAARDAQQSEPSNHLIC